MASDFESYALKYCRSLFYNVDYMEIERLLIRKKEDYYKSNSVITFLNFQEFVDDLIEAISRKRKKENWKVEIETLLARSFENTEFKPCILNSAFDLELWKHYGSFCLKWFNGIKNVMDMMEMNMSPGACLYCAGFCEQENYIDLARQTYYNAIRRYPQATDIIMAAMEFEIKMTQGGKGNFKELAVIEFIKMVAKVANPDVSFLMKLRDRCQIADLKVSIRQILQHIIEKYDKTYEAMDARIRLDIEKIPDPKEENENFQKALDKYVLYLERHPKMFEHFVILLKDLREQKVNVSKWEQHLISEQTPPEALKLYAQIKGIIDIDILEYCRKRLDDSIFYLKLMEIYTLQGQIDQAKKLFAIFHGHDVAEENYETQLKIWQLVLDNESNIDQVDCLFSACIKSLDLLKNNLMLKLYLNWLSKHRGIERCRLLFTEFSSVKTWSNKVFALYKELLRVELEQENVSVPHVRNCYRQLAKNDYASPDDIIEWMKFEEEKGDKDRILDIYNQFYSRRDVWSKFATIFTKEDVMNRVRCSRYFRRTKPY